MKRKNEIVPCLQDRIVLGVNTVLMVLFALIIAYPLAFVVLASFSKGTSVITLNIIPKSWSLEGYKAVFSYKWIWIGYRNSAFYTLLGSICGIVFCVLAAYPLSKPDLDGRGAIMGLFVFTMYFGGGLIPTYLTYRSYGLLDNLLVLILPGTVNVYNMIIMRTYFSSQIPGDLREAAFLDGCGEIRYLISIVLPLSVPILAVVGLYYAVGHWNSYFDAMVYMTTKTKKPLAIFLRDILILNESNDITSSMDPDALASLEERQNVMKYALIVISSVPMYILYPFIQKYFIKGIMIGSVKG